jgi:large subunit ribosomal protein L22
MSQSAQKQAPIDTEAFALAKGVSHSPRKVAVVCALVRGRSVADALTILGYTPRRASTAVHKVIASAAANAENNQNLKPNTLVIKTITVTAGPRIKRFRPAAHGRALPFQRKTSHIRVVVSGEKRAKPVKNTSAEKPKQAKGEK